MDSLIPLLLFLLAGNLVVTEMAPHSIAVAGADVHVLRRLPLVAASNTNKGQARTPAKAAVLSLATAVQCHENHRSFEITLKSSGDKRTTIGVKQDKILQFHAIPCHFRFSFF